MYKTAIRLNPQKNIIMSQYNKIKVWYRYITGKTGTKRKGEGKIKRRAGGGTRKTWRILLCLDVHFIPNMEKGL